MPGDRPNYINQLSEMWSRLQSTQRLTVLGFGLLGLTFIGALVYFVNRVEYEPLYHDLNREDAKAIADYLKKNKIEYDVDGSTILVAAPENKVDKLKLDIAASGLAGSGRVGYELFDKNQFGMTDFTEQLNYKRALEGELARTIGSLSEITQAHVYIVMPKDSVFEENKEDAKASAVLNLKKGQELSKESINGIKNLIAGAVQGLHSYNVSIIDEAGRLLSQSVESGDAARSEMESGLREQLEKEMAGKVLSILEPMVGKGKVHAKTSIDLDFSTTEQTEETYNTDPPIVRSQQKSEERQGGAAVPAGVPGIQSNLAPQAPASGMSIPEHSRSSEVTNYEANKLVRHTFQPKGTVIRRLSVAVTLDHKTIYKKSKDGKPVPSAEPLSQKDLDSYRDLVLAAVGYDEERGDVVTIKNIPFYSETKPDEPQSAVPVYVKYREYFAPGAKYLSIIVIFIIVYIIFIRPIRKKVFQTMSMAAIGPAGEAGELQLPLEGAAAALPGARHAEELGSAESAQSAAALPGSESGASDEILSLNASDEQIERELMKEANMIDLGGRKYAAMKKKLMDKAKKDPEMVSQLLRSLLREKA